jgi:cob(I)alamin adenosyltransferase
MKLYTKQGDGGQTALFGGQRVSKDHRRVEAYGAVDELNAAIGLALSYEMVEAARAALAVVQQDLFVVGGCLANPAEKGSVVQVKQVQVEALETWIDEATATTPPLRRFILPGGSPAGAALHLARTVCRRAEREVVRLSREEDVPAVVVVYLNRLSDLLFALARRVNHAASVPETEWQATQDDA